MFGMSKMHVKNSIIAIYVTKKNLHVDINGELIYI